MLHHMLDNRRRHYEKNFTRQRLWHFHIDSIQIRTDEGKLHLFVVLNRTSKFGLLRYMPKPLLRGPPLDRRRLAFSALNSWLEKSAEALKLSNF
tara:strand:+ start:4404 stop:4685 length:282 start_codon:yes stop_codon:yes gene_type:complete